MKANWKNDKKMRMRIREKEKQRDEGKKKLLFLLRLQDGCIFFFVFFSLRTGMFCRVVTWEIFDILPISIWSFFFCRNNKIGDTFHISWGYHILSRLSIFQSNVSMKQTEVYILHLVLSFIFISSIQGRPSLFLHSLPLVFFSSFSHSLSCAPLLFFFLSLSLSQSYSFMDINRAKKESKSAFILSFSLSPSVLALYSGNNFDLSWWNRKKEKRKRKRRKENMTISFLNSTLLLIISSSTSFSFYFFRY